MSSVDLTTQKGFMPFIIYIFSKATKIKKKSNLFYYSNIFYRISVFCMFTYDIVLNGIEIDISPWGCHFKLLKKSKVILHHLFLFLAVLL
jgi:hypothetical protein